MNDHPASYILAVLLAAILIAWVAWKGDVPKHGVDLWKDFYSQPVWWGAL